MPVLEVLEEFLIRHVHGSYLRESGQVGPGVAMQREALDDLLETHRAEIRRYLKPENPNS
jgi:hypothetical protein